jgi:sugar phosphate isomerase/epimerase
MARIRPTLHPSQLSGLTLSLEDKAALARRYGYAGLDFNLAEAQAFAGNDPGRLKDLLERYGLEANVVAGVLSANLFATDPEWDASLEQVHARAKAIAAYGGRRSSTVLANRAARPRRELWMRMAKRIWEVDRALDNTGVRLGVEFLGVRTQQLGKPYPFVSSMADANELLEAAGAANVGLILDSYHWHAAGDTLDTIRQTPARRLVALQINDAKPRPRFQLTDDDRLLPGEGVIPLPEWLMAVDDTGYDGFVGVEVLGKRLANADSEAAARLGIESLRPIFEQAGLRL